MEQDKKYVSLSKISLFLDNIKTLFAPISHIHTITNITGLDNSLSDIKASVDKKSNVQLITWGEGD